MPAQAIHQGAAGCRGAMASALFVAGMFASLAVHAYDVGSRILATSGATQVEGAAGGGLVPWAVLSGYGRDKEWGGELFLTHARTGDFDLTVAGASVAFNNRVELSAAAQLLDIEDLADDAGLPDDSLTLMVLGAKVRLAGDLIYGTLPQVSAGVQYKRNNDMDVPRLVGALDDDGFDFYVAASKLWLQGIGGYPVLANVTVRATRANQLGLLGFGGDAGDDWEPMFEGSIGVLVRRDMVVGYEYRQKPDNLRAVDEDDWHDVFVAWFPMKHLSITGAWAGLGSIGGSDNQDGFYVGLETTY